MENQQLQKKETGRLLVCTKPAAWGKLSRNHQGLAAVSKVTSIFCNPGEAQPYEHTGRIQIVAPRWKTKCHVLPQLLCQQLLVFCPSTSAHQGKVPGMRILATAAEPSSLICCQREAR